MSWERQKLGDLVQTQKGYAFKSAWYQETGRPIVKVSDFTEESVDTKSLVKIPEDIAEKFLSWELSVGEAVVQTVGSWPSNPASVVGKCIRIPSAAHGALLNQNAVRLSPCTKLDNGYLYYSLRSRQFRDYIIGTARGSANQASITLDAIRAFDIPLPHVGMQRRIVSILSAYDDLIENNRRRIQLLEQAARLLYKEWFVHLRFPGHEHVSITDGVPEGWEKKTVGELCSFTIGGGWGGEEHSSKFTDPAYVIRGTDLPDVKSGAFGRVPFRFHKSNNLAKRALITGDIILEVSNGNIHNIGRSYRVEGAIIESFDAKVMCASFCRLLRPIGEFESLMLASHFEEMQDNGRMDFFKSPSAAGINNFRFKALLEDAYVVIPSGVLQVEAEALLGALRGQHSTLAVQVAQLTQARDLLLPRFMNGEVAV
jgi:type I restriction enzyme S subunit